MNSAALTPPKPAPHRLRALAATPVLAAVVAAAGVAALRLGVRDTAWGDLWPASTSLGAEIVYSLRLPRACMAAAVGAALAVAGALMQALTRNRLAGPGLMGLAPGATLAVLAAMLRGQPSDLQLSAVAFVGAALGAALVFAVAAATPRGATPQRLVLAGAVVGGMLTSLTGTLIFRLQLSEVFLYWTLGGLSTTTWPQVWGVLPAVAAGLALAWLLAPSLTLLGLGEERAASAGLRVGRVRGGAALAVLLLAGAAVAGAGPVGFVGVMVPNLCRFWAGPSLRLQLPLAALGGAAVVLLADLVSRRFVGQFVDIPLGAVTAVLGAPAMIWIARSGVRRAR